MRGHPILALALTAGVLSAPLLTASPALAGTPATIASTALSVRVDSSFPRIIDYTAGGAVLNGNEDAIGQVVLNGTAYTPTVASTVAADHVDYALTFANGDEVDVTISVAGSTVDWRVTRIVDSAVAVRTMSVPSHNLVSVRSSQAGASIATTRMYTATTGTGDTFTPVTGTTATDTGPVGAMYAIVNTGQLAAAISTNSVYDNPSGGTASNNSRLFKQVTDKGAYRRAGLWSGDWVYRATGSTAPDALPDARIVIAGDRNADATVDWQDGAIAFRDIMTSPQGWQETKDRVVQRIPFNFASQATHPFLATLDETKRVAAATDGLGQFVLLKGYASEGHDSAHPDYGEVGTRQGGAADLNTLTTVGAQYNADFGVHINATEAYPVAKSFSDTLVNPASKGWDWLDQSYYIDVRTDGTSGARASRLAQLKAAAPGLKFAYVDVWYGDGWDSRRFAKEIHDQGFQLATEFPDKFEDDSLWSHWANDVNYGGSATKGINSQLVRFIRNSERDDWIAGNPLLGGGELPAYEGWQGKNDFTAFLNTTFSVDLPTKYLQGFTINKWAADRIDLSGGVNVSTASGTRTISKDGHPVLVGGKYLLPWDQQGETKLYHWNDAGGSSTWSLPSSWAANSTVKLYKLTDAGRVLVSDLPVTAGQVTINATAKTAYVVYPTAAPVQVSSFGEGQPLKDPGFYSGTLTDWTVSGAASVARNPLGQNELAIGAGATSVSQTLTGLTAGTYSASVYVRTAGGRRATLSVTPAGGTAVTNYTTSSVDTNYIGGDDKYQTTMQRMKVLFDIPGGQTTATLALQGAAGTAAITFDDVHIFKPGRTAQGTHYLYEDFEHLDGGWGPFVGTAGHDKDPQTHVAQLHAPYTQAGWNGKLIDDVIGGNNALKSHEESAGLLYKTLPQTLRFQPGRRYTVSFSYEQSVAGDYAFSLGAGTATLSDTNLAVAHTPTTFTKTFDAASAGDSWIGLKKLTGSTQNQDRDLVIDNLTVDDVGAGTGGGSNRLPQTQLTVKSVDSAETANENTPGSAALDGNSATFWGTQWSGTAAPMPHEIQLDLGGSYPVTNLYYLPRQDNVNGRIASFEIYVSADGVTWGTAAATGTWANGTAEQTVTFAARTGRYVKLRALSEVNGQPWTTVAELNVGVAAAPARIAQAGMSVKSYDSADDATGGQAANVLDGNATTMWHTAWSGGTAPAPPHEIQLDLGASYSVSCLYQLPRQTGVNGRIAGYEVYVSTDGVSWGTAAATGTWTNSAAEQSACFTARPGRYVKLRALGEVNGGAWTSVAELNVLGG